MSFLMNKCKLARSALDIARRVIKPTDIAVRFPLLELKNEDIFEIW